MTNEQHAKRKTLWQKLWKGESAIHSSGFKKLFEGVEPERVQDAIDKLGEYDEKFEEVLRVAAEALIAPCYGLSKIEIESSELLKADGVWF